MYYILLADGTRVNNCAVGTTSDNVIHVGDTFADAASIMDILDSENSRAIRVFDENDTEVAFGGDLVLLDGGTMGTTEDGKCSCTVALRHKTETEIMKDEIAELQDAILE